ncbi:hypothetical protein Goari_025116, partial [Gossypium aridum]|nr:hypothetical protein [Gossypium aridum]
DIIARIVSIPPPYPSIGPDRIIWGSSSKLPWKFQGPQWVRFFIWLTLRNRLLRNAKMRRWTKLMPMEKQVYIYSEFLSERMTKNLQSLPSSSLNEIDWPYHFGMLAWHLWKNRNNFVFKISLGARRKSSRSLIVGSQFAHNWVHLNIDGLVKIEDDFAVVGGLVKDYNGKWIFDYYKYLGCCSVLESKLWSILDGLNLALDRGFQCILIQMDSREAIKSI